VISRFRLRFFFLLSEERCVALLAFIFSRFASFSSSTGVLKKGGRALSPPSLSFFFLFSSAWSSRARARGPLCHDGDGKEEERESWENKEERRRASPFDDSVSLLLLFPCPCTRLYRGPGPFLLAENEELDVASRSLKRRGGEKGLEQGTREREREKKFAPLLFFFPSRFFSMPLPLNAFFPLLLGTSFFSLPGPRCSLCHFESLVVDFLDKLTIAEALGSFQRERKKRVMFPSKHRSRRSLFFHSFKTHLSPSLFLSSCSLSLNHQFKIEPFKHPVTMDPSYGGECFCCFRKRERKEEKDEGWSTKKKTQPLPTSSLPSSKKKQKKTPQQRKPGRSSRTRSTRSTTTTRPG